MEKYYLGQLVLKYLSVSTGGGIRVFRMLCYKVAWILRIVFHCKRIIGARIIAQLTAWQAEALHARTHACLGAVFRCTFCTTNLPCRRLSVWSMPYIVYSIRVVFSLLLLQMHDRAEF